MLSVECEAEPGGEQPCESHCHAQSQGKVFATRGALFPPPVALGRRAALNYFGESSSPQILRHTGPGDNQVMCQRHLELSIWQSSLQRSSFRLFLRITIYPSCWL